ncbi:sodium:calcium antiporter [Deferribacter autotrophicus]|uniref:Sodium:calcium antiporter n=1 Tax=Deferribacter autotrophicus TaxID=500465 RepID=A0A5A8F2Q9_9BACT|nr:sodium:calcium antiporter [Deferribacter autotrophicus]KAA0257779.1 sodium:calcium antiporter [Deferribacter autotrophicus]
MYYILFVVCAILIVYSGMALSKYGDVIASATNLGHSLVGILLLSVVTSLPELISSIGSVTVVDAPSLAFGNIFGSNMFNIFIIFLMDLLFKKDSIFVDISLANIVTGIYALLLTIVAIMGFVFKMPNFLWVSSGSIIIFVIYVASVYSAYRSSFFDIQMENEDEKVDSASLRKAVLLFTFFAIIIVVAGLLLSKSADVIALETGLGRSFVGAFLLAFVTSLPEISASIGAIRVGSANMAFGNIAGSCVFNVAILFFVDIFYMKGSVFEFVSLIHLKSALLSAIMLIIALIGVKQDKISRFRLGRISIYSFYIGIFYTFYLLYMYKMRGS